MEVIRYAELIVEWFLCTIEHTNRSLDIQCNVLPIMGFGRHMHGLQQTYAKRCIEYQVACWCAQSSKGTVLLCMLYLMLYYSSSVHYCT